MDTTRVETDSMGPVEIEATRLWGAQTQRSLDNFPIGRPRFRFTSTMIRSLGVIKSAAASANADLGVLDRGIADLITAASGEVIAGELDEHFPLVVFQTGSGTHTNMNANEVIANRAAQMANEPLGRKSPLHPNDHVNRSQSSNDVFPTAMHVAAIIDLREKLYPAADGVLATLDGLAARNAAIVKVGRTHLQDATPITLGQEIGSWAAQLRGALDDVRGRETALHALDLGGTATGTGMNSPSGFGSAAAERIEALTGLGFSETDNHFAATAGHDALVSLSASLRTLAGATLKMANDVRWLSSGPRNGIGELLLPSNEPGSSIMPGKVNPSQAEALAMVCTQVFGNDATVAFAGTQGNFQLNVSKPVIIHNVLESIALLAESLASFDERCLRGIEPNRNRIAANLETNLMVVTALTPHIGYDAAASIARTAAGEGSTLRDAALASGHVTEAEFNAWVDPAAMTRPSDPASDP